MSHRTIILFVLLTFVTAHPSHAYLDPTSGSILLQVLLGGVAGAVLILKLFWHRILGLFGVAKRDNEDPTD